MDPIVVTHGGVGAPEEWSDGCSRAADAAHAVLLDGRSALDAVVVAVEALEADGRFNAGRGSVLRLDGKTIENDSGVMDSEGRIGAVLALRGIESPVRAAREVLDSPHAMLAGEGALRFALARGLARRSEGPTDAVLRKQEKLMAKIAAGRMREEVWRRANVAALWNFEDGLPEELRPKDTVGAVARDRDGRFAAATSTGGAVPMLLGRVGDSPIPGAGFWVGQAGAVAATGLGEEIIRRLASKEVYDRMASGADPQSALAAVAALFEDEIEFGAIAVSSAGHGAAMNRPMARAVKGA